MAAIITKFNLIRPFPLELTVEPNLVHAGSNRYRFDQIVNDELKMFGVRRSPLILTNMALSILALFKRM